MAPITGLVLSGGGARGAYEVGIIAGIIEALGKKPRDKAPFQVFAGSSVGAINSMHNTMVRALEKVTSLIAEEEPNLLERLPKLARTVGMWVGRGRRFISSVKEDIDREIKADELRQILAKQKQSNPLHEIVEDTKKNFADIKSETESAVNAATKPAPPQNDKS